MFRDWKSSACCNIVGKDFETVKRLNLATDPKEWMKFCESSVSESSKEISSLFRNSWKNLPCNHRLGLGGYKVVEPKWEKEVADFIATSKPPSFSEH